LGIISHQQSNELLFAAGKEYDKGQVIIKEEALLVAKNDFISKSSFDSNNWEKYTKHDYAIFNPIHTWVEYINRLLGALAGIAYNHIYIIIWISKRKQKLILLTFLICVLMGFQAWLGKTVVDSVLNPFKITTHMLAALLIVALQLIVIYTVKKTKLIFNQKFNWILAGSLGLTIIQIVLGTTVREHVDIVSETGALKLCGKILL
jgi:cytochrome c oxidase assembly protein subunit 15